MSKIYTISSSDEDELPATPEKNIFIHSGEDLSSSKGLEFLLKKENLEKYNFSRLETSKTLLYQDITEDDEVWFLQCPKTVCLNDLQVEKIKFDSPVCKMKCKVTKGKKKKFMVYSIPSSSSQISLAVPNLETKKFVLKTLPVAGQVVFQEKVSFKNNVNDIENQTDEKPVFSENS